MEIIKRKYTRQVEVAKGWSTKKVMKYYVQTIERGRRSEFGSGIEETILIILSVLLLGIPWLLVYEVYQLAHKDQIIERVVETREISKQQYELGSITEVK